MVCLSCFNYFTFHTAHLLFINLFKNCNSSTVLFEGRKMHETANAFALDPCTASKRASMVKSSRSLLSSVARLLCIADMADVQRLLASLKKV